MVLAPPSVKIPIGVYSIICNAEIADAPDWLIDLAVSAGNGGGSGDHPLQPLDVLSEVEGPSSVFLQLHGGDHVNAVKVGTCHFEARPDGVGHVIFSRQDDDVAERSATFVVWQHVAPGDPRSEVKGEGRLVDVRHADEKRDLATDRKSNPDLEAPLDMVEAAVACSRQR